MQTDLPRPAKDNIVVKSALAHHAAFASLFCALVAIVTVLALDLTFLIPLTAGAQVYSPAREFLSYLVDEKTGPLMMGVFLLVAVSAWSYAAAAHLAPSRHSSKTNLVATFLFGCGLFVAAAFRAVPADELEVNRWLQRESWLHDIGVAIGFGPAMIAAFLDQKNVVFKCPGFLLTKVSFWCMVVGAIGVAFALLFYQGIAGLMQRVLVVGVLMWLATEAHQLFWSSIEGTTPSVLPSSKS
ncbi:DUF998 domain-containing protein [bacterium]|nr:MAG: DUF998 domain-containing protein [bacterium]